MKLLLHTCCAPCAIYPVEIAKKEGFDLISSFFYNPNIHPATEFIRRRDEMLKIEKINELNPDQSTDEYFNEIKDFDNVKERCHGCWNLRIGKTAEAAKKRGFDAFTTTLLASPYQDHDVLKKICALFSESHGIKFYYRDFRAGFKPAHKKAKDMKIYCQGYCGCVFSLIERYEPKKPY